MFRNSPPELGLSCPQLSAGHGGRRADSPPFARRGVCAHQRFPELCAQTGRLVKLRSLLIDFRAALLSNRCASRPSVRWLRDINNRPVCATKEREHFLIAQPPRLAKAGKPFSHSELSHILSCPANRLMGKGVPRRGGEYVFQGFELKTLVTRCAAQPGRARYR